MGMLNRLMSGSLQATWAPDDNRWYQPIGGAMTPAGMQVGAEDALKISAWYRGRDILATVLAMLPLPVMERLANDGGAEPARQHPLWDILHDKPNLWQDSFQWRRQAMYHLIDYGNHYCRIIEGRRGFVDQLQPIHPRQVTPQQTDSGDIAYTVRDPRRHRTTTYSSDVIFHVRGATDDGIVGKGILEYARSSLGTALAEGSYAAAIFGKGALNGGVIENPGVLNDEASKRMAASFLTATGDWHLPKVLEQGSKWVPNKITPEDAQMILSRKFSIDDMARWLGIPRQMLENSDPSFGNAEQFDDNFLTYSMGPWLSMWEFAINSQLMLNPRRFYVEFTRDAIVRGKFLERAQGNVAYVNAGIYTVDEVRAKEGKNTRGGKADELRDPQNITGKPTAPAGPTPTKKSDAQTQAIVFGSAERLIRKEVKAVMASARRHAKDQDAFAVAVTEFYADHAVLVSDTLSMPLEDAQQYCAGQAGQAIAQGLEAVAHWQTAEYARWVAALAVGSHAD